MPRKKPIQEIAIQSRRWSDRRKAPISPATSKKPLSKSPTKTRLPPPRSSPLSGTQSSDSLYDGLAYQEYTAPAGQSVPAPDPLNMHDVNVTVNVDPNHDFDVNANAKPDTTTLLPTLTGTLTEGMRVGLVPDESNETTANVAHVEPGEEDQTLGESSQITHPPSPPPLKLSSPLSTPSTPLSALTPSPHLEPVSSQSSRLSSPPPEVDDYEQRREMSLTPPRLSQSSQHGDATRISRSTSKSTRTVRKKGKRSLPLDPASDCEPGPSQRRRRVTASTHDEPNESPTTNNPFKSDFAKLMADIKWEELNPKEATPEPVEEEEEEVRPVKEPRAPTRLPVGVKIGSTCLYLFRSSWFLAKLVRFEPGPTLATDRYFVQARDIVNEKKAKRAEILFLIEPKVKTLKRLGGLSRGVIDPDYYKSDAYTRAATPPLDETDNRPFEEWTRQAQLYHIRPHLLRVIQDNYPPARPRAGAFYLNKEIPYFTGDWEQDELSNFFAPELRRWLFRPHADSIPDQAPRPIGSEMFEQLNEADKSKFLINVLIPESLIQLEILLNGQTPDLLALPEQEQYTRAGKRMIKRKRQKDPWEEREVEAKMAMGHFKAELDDAAKRQLLLDQKTHIINFAGYERLVKKVDYKSQL